MERMFIMNTVQKTGGFIDQNVVSTQKFSIIKSVSV